MKIRFCLFVKKALCLQGFFCFVVLVSCFQKSSDFSLEENGDYKVTRIVDGDTYVVEDENGIKEKIRLIGVNTPETKHPKKGVEPFGPEATAFAMKYLNKKVVQLKFEKDKKDRYNRILAHVFINDIHFNKMLIDSGFGTTMFFKPNEKFKRVFTESQEVAKSKGLGLWQKR